MFISDHSSTNIIEINQDMKELESNTDCHLFTRHSLYMTDGLSDARLWHQWTKNTLKIIYTYFSSVVEAKFAIGRSVLSG